MTPVLGDAPLLTESVANSAVRASAVPIGSGSHPGPQKDKGLNRPARYCNSRSGLTIRSGDNPTSTVAATRIGRMGGWVRL